MAVESGVVILVLSLAGFVQGLTGFGFGLVAMSLLPLLLDLKSAAAISVVFNILVTALTLFANRRHFEWRTGWPLIIGSCCGVPLGVYLLVLAPHQLLLRLLGAIMIASAVNELAFARRGGLGIPERAGFALGVVSGGLSGAFNMGGPPAIAYVYSQPWRKEAAVAVLQVVFGLAAVLRLILFGATGLLSLELWRTALWGALPVFTAILLGTRFFHRVSQERLRYGVFLFLGALGAKYFIWP